MTEEEIEDYQKDQEIQVEKERVEEDRYVRTYWEREERRK